MQENFLHFIWQHQYFDKRHLVTTAGEPLSVLGTGHRNDHSGPDFSHSRLKIGSMEWYGFTEIHIKSSDWLSHRHQEDAGYNKVVLHVVWKDDRKVSRQDGTAIPTLELKGRVTTQMIDRYRKLTGNPEPIPCSGQWARAEEIVRLSMLDKALFQRIEKKSRNIYALLDASGNSWEEVAYRWLVQHFGFKVNNHAFACLANGLPYRIISKYRTQIVQLEALLFGQAGFLDREDKDKYCEQLAQEYEFLAHKHNLYTKRMNRHQWRFLRLRPANFPTVRLAQLAQLLHRHANLFALFRDTRDYQGYTALLRGVVSDYWLRHYDFGKPRSKDAKGMGRGSIENLVINSAVPLLVAYGKQMDETSYLEKAVQLLQSVKAEKNHITRQWVQLGVHFQSAFDSQAMIELYNGFCIRKRCLSCNIGAHLIKTA